MENSHHDEGNELFNQIESVEEEISDFVTYMDSLNVARHVANRLLNEEGEEEVNLILTGSESRRFITDCYYAENVNYDVLPPIFGESSAYYQLLIYRDKFPENALHNSHLTVVLNSALKSEHRDYMFSSQVTHIFADASSVVFGKGWKIGSLETIQSGRLGPYINSTDSFTQVVNTARQIKLSPDKFSAQHWRIDQLVDPNPPKKIDVEKRLEDLHPLLDYIEYTYRDYLPSN